MTRRFSSQQLSLLRNEIPIERVIVKFLSIQNHHNTGKLRFACPVCQGFDTSIHTQSNLARCFACQRNFNTIEIVMAHRKIGFVDSVKWLKQCNTENYSKNEAVTNRKPQTSPSKFGDILSEILPTIPPPAKTVKPSSETMLGRIENLEKRVDHLYRLLEKLRS